MNFVDFIIQILICLCGLVAGFFLALILLDLNLNKKDK